MKPLLMVLSVVLFALLLWCSLTGDKLTAHLEQNYGELHMRGCHVELTPDVNSGRRDRFTLWLFNQP
jgi:hypothetical protein